MRDPIGVSDSYDLVAPEYAAEYRDELTAKPSDRRMLAWPSRSIFCSSSARK
ncbi:MAG: hypothetical protein ABI914_06620 [Acidobacteriota bacterium]